MAQKIWCSTNTQCWFLPYWQFQTPTQWATKLLGFNIATALARHVIRANRQADSFQGTKGKRSGWDDWISRLEFLHK